MNFWTNSPEMFLTPIQLQKKNWPSGKANDEFVHVKVTHVLEIKLPGFFLTLSENNIKIKKFK